MTRPSGKAPPTLLIDEQEPWAWMRFIAGSVWADDPRRMASVLATFTSELMGILRDTAERPAVSSLDELARQLGIPVSELVHMPGATPFYAAFFAEPRDTYQLLDQTIFQELGHHRAAASAPSSQQILSDFTKAFCDGALYAGLLLGLTAILAHRHPSIPASLNRAIAILEGQKARGRIQLPSDRTLLSAWKKWRHVAPLWAASIGAIQDAQGLGLSHLSSGLEALQDPSRFGSLLGHAKWYRRFATTFVPEHAIAPLVPPGDALVIVCRTPEMEPRLAILDEADLDAATQYRAPTRKFFGLAG